MCQKLCHELNTHYLTYHNSSTKKMLLLSLDNETDSDCSHKIKRCLLLGRSYDKPRQYIKKQRTKVHIVKAMALPVIMNECESGAMKKAECRRIDAFKL